MDESQNLTASQLKTIITRCGEGTKIIVGGNLAQIDSNYLSAYPILKELEKLSLPCFYWLETGVTEKSIKMISFSNKKFELAKPVSPHVTVKYCSRVTNTSSIDTNFSEAA